MSCINHIILILRQAPPGMLFWKLPLSLHVEHEVAAVHVFDDKEESVGRRWNMFGISRFPPQFPHLNDRINNLCVECFYTSAGCQNTVQNVNASKSLITQPLHCMYVTTHSHNNNGFGCQQKSTPGLDTGMTPKQTFYTVTIGTSWDVDYI